MRAAGYKSGDALVTDLPNVSSNLVLQLACSRLGVAFVTAKEGGGLVEGVVGAVPTSGASWLSRLPLPLPPLLTADAMGFAERFPQLIEAADFDGAAPPPAAHPLGAHAFFNSTTALTGEDCLALGDATRLRLGVCEDDTLCVSITLCHAFGVGSAATAALLAGAAVALPAVGGIRGCGVPSERAAATLHTLEAEQCTLLFADTHTLDALAAPAKPLTALRGGVCKVGSGSDFLGETRDYAGVALETLGKAKA